MMFERMREGIVHCHIDISNRISVEEYSKIREAAEPHVLLDVRSSIQFDMVALVSGNASQNIVNIPLKKLQTLSVDEIYRQLSFGSDREEMQRAAVYVLCRRGIDSVTATRRLLDIGFKAATVKNIDGGLDSWRSKVDSGFPMY